MNVISKISAKYFKFWPDFHLRKLSHAHSSSAPKTELSLAIMNTFCTLSASL